MRKEWKYGYKVLRKNKKTSQLTSAYIDGDGTKTYHTKKVIHREKDFGPLAVFDNLYRAQDWITYNRASTGVFEGTHEFVVYSCHYELTTVTEKDLWYKTHDNYHVILKEHNLPENTVLANSIKLIKKIKVK